VLNRIAAEIGALTQLQEFLNHVHSIVCEELDIEDVLIWLHDEPGGEFSLVAGITELAPPAQLREFSNDQQLPARPDSDLRVLVRDDGADMPDRSVICPMFVEDSLIGLIELVLHDGGAVDDRDIDLVQAIAAPVASTIRVAQLHDEAKRAAMTDGLTGVLNHRAFYEELDRRIAKLDAGEEIHLLIVDVIGLKAINDNHGHIAGDHVLRTVAGVLVKRLRENDIVARYGGDEFAAILTGPLNMPIEEIVEGMERAVPCVIAPGAPLSLRLRCGHASTSAQEGRATELVARADALLYSRVRPTERSGSGR
jgi:diguanylate cyclase (GGDEF)-like protein